MVSSLALSILTFAGMQVFKDELSTEGRMTILGGFFGSWFFVFFVNVSGGGLYLEKNRPATKQFPYLVSGDWKLWYAAVWRCILR